MICPFCETRNPDDAEFCKFCNQRFTEEIDFDEPLKKLNEISNRLIRRDISADRSFLRDEFEKIEEEIQSLMDRATDVIEKNIQDIARQKKKTQMELGDLNLDTFNNFLNEFDTAQKLINNGLARVRESLIEAETSDEITRGMVDYSAAMTEISEGLSQLETITSETSDVFTMTSKPENIDVPREVFESRDELEKAQKSLDIFSESQDERFLEYALVKIERSKEALLRMLEEPTGEEEEEEDEYAKAYTEEEEIKEEFAEEELEEEEALELMYRDVEDIVSDEEIEEMMKSPYEEDLDIIYRDPDWQEILRQEEKLVAGEELEVSEPETDEEAEGEFVDLAATLSALREEEE